MNKTTNMNEERIKAFNSIRDIPYKLAIKWGDENHACSGKSDMLLNKLTAMGEEMRYRICWFKWSTCDLPEEIIKIPHDDDCPHTYLEIKIGDEWKVLDPTWDPMQTHFPFNEWDGQSATEIAVTPDRILSPEKSKEIVEGRTEAKFVENRQKNGEFFCAINEWLETFR
jgi:hypothetical protein